MATYNQFTSDTAGFQNQGAKREKINAIGVIKQVVLAPKGTYIDTFANAMLLATWNTKFKLAKTLRMYPLKRHTKFEDKSSEDSIDNTSLDSNKTTVEGDRGYTIMINANMAEVKQLRSFTGKRMTVYEIDDSQSILGTTSDGIKFEGYDCFVTVSAPKFANDKEKRMTAVTIMYDDSTQMSDNIAVIEPKNQTAGWNPLTEFDGVYDVNLTLVSANATTVVVSVNLKNIPTTDVESQIAGLVKADFAQKSSAGATKTITGTVVDNLDGTYTITSSFATNDTINLVVCSSISLAIPKVESTGAISVGTIS